MAQGKDLRQPVPESRRHAPLRRAWPGSGIIRTREHDYFRGRPVNFLRLTPVFLSCLVLAAHFYRGAELVLVAVSLLLPLLLLIRNAWVPRVIQLALVLGAVEWLYTGWRIAQVRMQLDMPWERMAWILGGVALFTALSGLVFFSRSLRRRYSSG